MRRPWPTWGCCAKNKPTCKISSATLKLTDNLIVSPDTSTVYVELLTDWTAESGSFWFEAAMERLRAISVGMISF
jgi:hypothetical protein